MPIEGGLAFLFVENGGGEMKLKINSLLGSLIIIAIISVFSFPAFATDVGGIIYTDTTWTLSGSPYNVISNVQIPEGIVLTVEPGVKIYDVTQYSNGNIQVWGSFNAIGTTSSTIILNSVNLYSESNSAMITIKYSELNSWANNCFQSSSPSQTP